MILYEVIITTSSIPIATSYTGTIITLGTQLNGQGTSFTSNLRAGDWIYDYTSQNEVQEVESVQNDTQATLSAPFTVDITTPINFTAIPQLDLFDTVFIQNAGAGTGQLNNKPLPATLTVSYERKPDKVDAITLDGTGTTLIVSN